MRLTTVAAAAIGGAGAGAAAYVGLVTGRLTVDLGIGRRTRTLGPIVVEIAAPREVVYETAAAPYAEIRPRALAEKVDILERTDQMVLAAHRTPVGGRLTAVTVETVTFDPPELIGFRLVRGPVPYVAETFELEQIAGGTRLAYTGELGTDLGRVGALWGSLVARSWEGAVQTSLDAIKAEAERRDR
jgi:hypothetical protein